MYLKTFVDAGRIELFTQRRLGGGLELDELELELELELDELEEKDELDQ